MTEKLKDIQRTPKELFDRAGTETEIGEVLSKLLKECITSGQPSAMVNLEAADAFSRVGNEPLAQQHRLSASNEMAGVRLLQSTLGIEKAIDEVQKVAYILHQAAEESLSAAAIMSRSNGN